MALSHATPQTRLRRGSEPVPPSRRVWLIFSLILRSPLCSNTASRPPIIFSKGGNPKVGHPTSPLAPGRSRTRGFPWEGLGCAAMAREKRCRDKPTTSTKRSGQFPKNPNRHRGVIPKRGYVTQRSGVPPSPKSNFAAFSGKGHEAVFEFRASPYRGCTAGLSAKLA